MDILLTHGYFLQEDRAERRIMKPYPPLGILYISAYLKSKGFDAQVYDTTFNSKRGFAGFIAEQRPPVVGISVNLMTKLNALEQIGLCKARGCTVIVGGPDVPEYAEKYIEHGADVAVIGEGEGTVGELLPLLLEQGERKLESVRGIVFRSPEGAVIRTPARPLIPDLDALPFPDRESIDIDRYLETWRTHHGMGSVSIICARGCPYTCTWCSRSVFGETHRRRSVTNVVDEIHRVMETQKPDMLWFADDVFAINHKWFLEFHAEMKRRNMRIPFECISRADRLNEDILEKMAELGCFRVWFGSESGSQRVLDAMQRRVTTEEIRATTRSARKHGIQAGLFVMLGYPGETIEDIEATVRHLEETNPDSFLQTVAYPIKGTPFYKDVKHAIYSSRNWEQATDRDLRIHGRQSDRFYWFAIRYLVNRARRSALRRGTSKSALTALTLAAKSGIARFGMELTRKTIS